MDRAARKPVEAFQPESDVPAGLPVPKPDNSEQKEIFLDRDTYLQVIHEHMKSSYLLDEEKIRTILPGFLNTLQQQLQTVEQCLDRGDLSALGKAGHTLKGALLNLGLFELADVAYSIEQQGKQQAADADYSEMISYLGINIRLITAGEDQD